MEKFTDIQKYFPYDFETWGQGKVIITTRDSNIENNKHVNNTIQIGELSPPQKLDLFSKIMNGGKKDIFSPSQKKAAITFLEKIPSYPLDISITAYYLKSTNISYSQYLDMLVKDNQDISKEQENILKETGDYTKTRYGIITVSLQQLINTHPDFRDLLLFISLLDSQNIPKDLLSYYKSSSIVYKFIYHLKKHSLITSESTLSSSGSVFSIHRSTQEIILNYLFNKLALDKNHQPLFASGRTLENYMSKANDDEDYEKMKLLITHSEKYLTYSDIIPQKIRNIIEGQLGFIYFHLNQDIKAKELLEQSLMNLKKYDDQNHDKIFWTSWVLGDIYKVLSDYQKSKALLESTWNNFKNYYPKNHINIAHICGILGDMYRTTGEYENAIGFFEQSLVLYKKHLSEEHNLMGRLMGFLGNAHVLVGNYKEGKSLIEKSLMIHKKHFPEDHVNVARILKFQGILENKLGNYEKSQSLLERSIHIYQTKYSKENLKAAWVSIPLGNTYINLNKSAEVIPLLEQALKIHRKFLPENQLGVGMTLAVLGDVYRTTADYPKAKQLLEESLKIHRDHYGVSHIETARVLLSLGQVYLQEENLEAAENQFRDAQSIFQKNKHPDIYIVYEVFSDLYNQKSSLAIKNGDVQLSEHFKNQAINDLRQALEIVKTHFSVDSPHRVKIESKLKKLDTEG